MKVRFKGINTINSDCDFPLSATNKNKYRSILNTKNSGRYMRHSEIPNDIINKNNDSLENTGKIESIRKKYLARSKEKAEKIQEKSTQISKPNIGTPSELIIKAREFSKIRNSSDNSREKIENDENLLTKFNTLNYHENQPNINKRNIRNNKDQKFPNTKTDIKIIDNINNTKDFSTNTYNNLKKNR